MPTVTPQSPADKRRMLAAFEVVRTLKFGPRSSETALAWVNSKFHVRSFKAGESTDVAKPDSKCARDTFQVCHMNRDPKIGITTNGLSYRSHVDVLSQAHSWEEALKDFAGPRAIKLFHAELSRKT